jgi:AraC-like DNA-binding protein
LFHFSPLKIINSLCGLSVASSSREVAQLTRKLKRSSSIKRKVEILENYLICKSYNALSPCDYIEKSLELIENAKGHIMIKNIIDRIFVSERQMDRRFRQITGISPKQYSKIIQLHFVINLMNMKMSTMFQDIAYFANYYDLSDLSHKFKKLTGFTPIEFINSDKHLAFQYYTDLVESE